MALLLLWEVDHQRAFPSQGGTELTPALAGFTRRLQLRAAQEPRLAWLQSADLAVPLAPGLAPSYHRRWSVRVRPPVAGEPRGWYDDFVTRWQAYIEALVCPPGSRPMSEISAELLVRVRPDLPQGGDTASSSSAVAATSSTASPVATPPDAMVATPSVKKRRRAKAPVGAAAPGAQPSVLEPPPARRQRVVPPRTEVPLSQPASAIAAPNTLAEDCLAFPPDRRPHRPRDEVEEPAPPRRKQRTLLEWFRPPAASSEDPAARAEPHAARHGRAAAGPPT